LPSLWCWPLPACCSGRAARFTADVDEHLVRASAALEGVGPHILP
jgi:hypothetical protein